jgi:hypothetical protein
MPKRPPSAYDIFFAHERQRELKSGSLQSAAPYSHLVGAPKRKIGFAGLARSVAAKWKTLDITIKSQYEEEAGKEQGRYKREMVEDWKQNQETRQLRHQQLQAQLAASDAMQTPSVAQLQVSRSLGDSFMGIRNDISTFNFIGNQTYQMAPEENLPSVALQQQSVWPTMPQTIASLGNMYDGEKSQQGRTTDPIYAAAGLPQPKGVLESSAVRFQAQNVPQGTNTARFPLSANPFEPPKQGIAPVHSDLRDLTAQSTVPHRDNSIASQLSSPPQRINNLASQLDDESFDFLKSLKNGIGSSQPNGVLESSAVLFQAQNAPQVTNTARFPLSANLFDQPKQGIAPIHSDSRDLTARSTVPHRVDSIASQLSSRQRINNLVSQLDDESFDFLKSLKNGSGSSPDNT